MEEKKDARAARARKLTDKYKAMMLDDNRKKYKRIFAQLKALGEVMLESTRDPKKLTKLRFDYEKWQFLQKKGQQAEADLRMYMSKEEWRNFKEKLTKDARTLEFVQKQAETVLRHYDGGEKGRMSTTLPPSNAKALKEENDHLQTQLEEVQRKIEEASRHLTPGNARQLPRSSTPMTTSKGPGHTAAPSKSKDVREKKKVMDELVEDEEQFIDENDNDDIMYTMHNTSASASSVYSNASSARSNASSSRSYMYRALDPMAYRRRRENIDNPLLKLERKVMALPQYSAAPRDVSSVKDYEFERPPRNPPRYDPPRKKDVQGYMPPPILDYDEFPPLNLPMYQAPPNKHVTKSKRERKLKSDDNPDVTVLDAINRLADVLETKMKDKPRPHKLPSMEPDTFKGDILSFPLWISSFEALIEKHVKEPTERLYFLGHYTAGDAYETIKGFLHLRADEDADEIYVRAKCLLMNQYGDKVRIADAYKRKLASWPNIKDGDGAMLTKFSNFLWQCQSAMESMGHLSVLNDSDEITKTIRRLPNSLIDRWQRVVDYWMYGEPEDNTRMVVTATDTSPPFIELCRFVASEARIANGPCSLKKEIPKAGEQKTDTEKTKKKTMKGAVALQTAASAEEEKKIPKKDSTEGKKDKRTPYCYYCKKEHFTFQCEDFLGQKLEFRQTFVKENGMCYGCLRKGHMFKDCRTKNPNLWKDRPKRKVEGKEKEQEPAEEEKTEKESNKPAVNLATIIENKTKRCTAILPVEVWHVSRPDLVIRTYCALDSQSNSTFIKKSLVEEIQAPNREVNLELTTMGSSGIIKSAAVDGLIIRGVNEDKKKTVDLPNTYVREQIPAQREAIPNKKDIMKWKHLESVADKLMPLKDDMDIGLLVGYNCSEALYTERYQNGTRREPYGMKTVLGWSVIGPVAKDENQKHIAAVCFKTQAKEVTADLFKKAFDTDFEDNGSDSKMSQEDYRFMKIMQESMVITVDNHFQLDLPFKEDDMTVPNNRSLAVKCLNNLKRKLLKDQVLLERYAEFMNTLFRLGHAENVPADEIWEMIGRTWYLPHMGVYHPRKLDQLRVVFHASIVYFMACLNKMLLSGPDLTNNLIGVLLRFREEKIGITCDVEKMFHQVRVSPKHRDFMRFLWFKNNDPKEEITEHRMTVHFFGATSSPGCANYALKSVARVHGHKYSKDVSDFITRHFYVDDGLASRATEEEALNLIHGSHSICQDGGFNLTKYNSTSRAVLEKIHETLKAKSVKEVNLSKGSLPVETTLGTKLDMEKDNFTFAVSLKLDVKTRRMMLSALSSVYDPLGFVSAAILPGRAILQALCQQALAWDEVVGDELQAQWDQWYMQLLELNKVTIPRCLRRTVELPILSCQLHHFCDASMVGYGTASYLRITDKEGRVDVSLIFAKSKVNPTKPVTVPRLELQAGVLAAKAGRFLETELPYKNVEHFIWSDSCVVLGYVHNQTKRFHIYVANRIQTIKEKLPDATWLYVPTAENPADTASRGCSAEELKSNETWWRGPSFLHNPTVDFSNTDVYEVNEADPEVKKESINLATQVKEKSMVEQVINRYSALTKLKKTLAYWLKYVRVLRHRIKNRNEVETIESLRKRLKRTVDDVPSILNVQMLQDAEKVIIRTAQKDAFPVLYDSLEPGFYPTTRTECRQRKANIKGKTNLYRLDIYKDSEEILRVGGRLKRGNLTEQEKHPMLVPKGHRVTQLIIGKCHEKTAHSGRNITLNRVRQEGYWVVHGRSGVDKQIKKCVTCKKLRGQPMVQLMSDLPKERVEPSEPFTHTGADVFGPFLIKVNRSYHKRWCVLFTCLACRAVHLEVLCSMNTSSFINAFRRLVARRGPVRVIYCDRGTNFTGASSELKKALKEMNTQELKHELLEERCDLVEFKFNFPKSSHMGGSWERLIRCVRGVLTQLLKQNEAQLNDELLQTFLLEAEAIVNSRPLSYIDMTSPDSDPITPAQLLTLKTTVVLPPPGVFEKEDLYCHSTWRKVQFLANAFWDKWKRDYLPSLHERKKWNAVEDNLQADDIVLVCDDGLPRNHWVMGRIIQTYPGDDGLVRKATLRTKNGVYDRPIHKLIMLIKNQQTTQKDVN